MLQANNYQFDNLPAKFAIGGSPRGPYRKRFFKAYTIIIVNASHRIPEVSSWRYLVFCTLKNTNGPNDSTNNVWKQNNNDDYLCSFSYF